MKMKSSGHEWSVYAWGNVPLYDVDIIDIFMTYRVFRAWNISSHVTLIFLRSREATTSQWYTKLREKFSLWVLQCAHAIILIKNIVQSKPKGIYSLLVSSWTSILTVHRPFLCGRLIWSLNAMKILLEEYIWISMAFVDIHIEVHFIAMDIHINGL